MNNLGRKAGVIAAVLLIIGAAVATKKLSEQKKDPPKKEVVADAIREVSILPVSYGAVPTQVVLDGRLKAFEKIELYAEVGGKLLSTSKPFKEGTAFAKGSLLMKIDAQEARLGLQAQRAGLLNAISLMMPTLAVDYPKSEAQWKAYIEKFDMEKTTPILPTPLSTEEKYLVANRNVQNLYFQIKSAEERLGKYQLFAPFSGVITNAMIFEGSTVRQGQKLGELMNTSRYELEATVPLSELKYLKIGHSIQLNSTDVNGQWKGTISRISDQIDPTTQNVKVYAQVTGQSLRDGMYLKGTVTAGAQQNAMSIPRGWLVDNQKVYIVNKDNQLELVPVDVLKRTSDQAIIQGLPIGTPLLNEKPIGAYEGEKVAIIKG